MSSLPTLWSSHGRSRIDVALRPARRLLGRHPQRPAALGRRHVVLEPGIGPHPDELPPALRLAGDDGQRGVEDALAPLERRATARSGRRGPAPPIRWRRPNAFSSGQAAAVDDPAAAGMGMLHEIAADLVVLVAEARHARAAEPRILDPAGGEDERPRPDRQPRRAERARLDPLDPAGRAATIAVTVAWSDDLASRIGRRGRRSSPRRSG